MNSILLPAPKSSHLNYESYTHLTVRKIHRVITRLTDVADNNSSLSVDTVGSLCDFL